jgi:hypothetical protein
MQLPLTTFRAAPYTFNQTRNVSCGKHHFPEQLNTLTLPPVSGRGKYLVSKPAAFVPHPKHPVSQAITVSCQTGAAISFSFSPIA